MLRNLNQAGLGIVLMLTVMISSAADGTAEQLDKPVSANSAETYRFEILSDSGYTDERGRNVIDVLEGYQVFLALSVDTTEGQPVIGLEPEFDFEGSSLFIPPGETSSLTSTDESGILEFGITAGKKGMDRLTVSYGNNEATVYFNIISLAIFDAPRAPTLESGLNWSELMQAQIDFVDGGLEATFPESIQQQDGDTVQVAGFVLPLEPDLEQKYFLLTSSPPHCFFHIPGGPAGVIEVFADDGIEASWDPVRLQGKLELVKLSETGVIYQLLNAEVVDE